MTDNVVEINNGKPAGMGWASIESEFNHHHYTAEGIAGLLFYLSNYKDGMEVGGDKRTMDSATYALQAAVHDMSRMFDKLLHLHLKSEKALKSSE